MSHADDATRHTASERFSAYLHEHDRRCTSERFAILDAVMGMPDHFSIETFGERLEQTGYHVSVATIYNTFQLLCDAGLLRRHKLEHKSAEYERVMPGQSHAHLICTECGVVREVRDTELARSVAKHRFPRFSQSYFTLYIYGLCSKCQRRRRK